MMVQPRAVVASAIQHQPMKLPDSKQRRIGNLEVVNSKTLSNG